MPDVRYALLQQSLDIPPTDALRRAFESIRKLTAADAPTMARDAFGILVKDLTASDAFTLKDALAREGILAESVPQKLLPQLPATKFVRQLSFGEDCLLLQNPLGRPVALPYRQLTVLAAGQVEGVRFDRPGPKHSNFGSSYPVPSAVRLALGEPGRPEASRTREVRAQKHFIELIAGRATARFTLEADTDADRLFTALGSRRTPDFAQNLSLLVRDLSQAAPHLLLNRGAYALRMEPPTPFAYPSRHAFYEELTWILWQAARGNYGESAT